MICLAKNEKIKQLNREFSAFIRECRPSHARLMEYGERDWFLACNKAFVKVMREHHPEREVKCHG